ncbi:MAG TPA: J domain-containing protein [Alphaproteobacteria bacterium]
MAIKTDNSITTVSAYDILGIAPDVDQLEIHAALRKLALAWHPDRVPSWRRGEATLRFQSILDAYNKIRTPDTRRNYDETLFALGGSVKKRFTAPRTTVAARNDNLPFGVKARAWFKALETVFWPVRSKN